MGVMASCRAIRESKAPQSSGTPFDQSMDAGAMFVDGSQ